MNNIDQISKTSFLPKSVDEANFANAMKKASQNDEARLAVAAPLAIPLANYASVFLKASAATLLGGVLIKACPGDDDAGSGTIVTGSDNRGDITGTNTTTTNEGTRELSDKEVEKEKEELGYKQ